MNKDTAYVQVECPGCVGVAACEICKGAGKVQWPAADQEWLGKLALPLQRAALKHGRDVFTSVMRAGACNHAGSILLDQLRTRGDLMQAAMTLMKAADQAIVALLEARGHSMEEFQACMRDVELVAQLAGAGAGGTVLASAGGLQ